MSTILVWLLILQSTDGHFMSKEFADQDSCERTLSRQVYAYRETRPGYAPIGSCTQVRVLVPAQQKQEIIVKPTIVIKQPKVKQ